MVGGNVDWFSLCKKQYYDFSKKLRIENSSDTTIRLLSIYFKGPKTIFQNYIFTPMFVSYSTIHNSQYLETPKCLRIHERLKKLWLYTKWNSALLQEKNVIMKIFTIWMEILVGIMLSVVRRKKINTEVFHVEIFYISCRNIKKQLSVYEMAKGSRT